MKKLKLSPTKTNNTILFLYEHDQYLLGLKLTTIEIRRIILNIIGRKLNVAHDKNKARFDSVRIDIDHFMLIHNEKG